MGIFWSGAAQTDVNLENYCLIWLDALVNSSDENCQAQQELRKYINYLLTFENDQQCFEQIHSLSKNIHIFLIVSGRTGKIFVPKVAHLPQIISIYVYCTNKEANEEWAQHFPKVSILSTHCILSIFF